MSAYLARTLAGHMVKDIAEYFRRSPMRISRATIEFEIRLGKDESLRNMVDQSEKDLNKRANKKYFITIAWHHLPHKKGEQLLESLRKDFADERLSMSGRSSLIQ